MLPSAFAEVEALDSPGLIAFKMERSNEVKSVNVSSLVVFTSASKVVSK